MNKESSTNPGSIWAGVFQPVLMRLLGLSCACAVLVNSANSFGQVTVLSEGFEGAFPGAWLVGDANPDEEPAFWADVDESFVTAHSGDWTAYCAGVGFTVQGFRPAYQPEMYAYLSRSIDLAGLTSATLTFWHFIPSIEEGIDECAVYIDNTPVWFRSSANSGWQQETISLNAFVGGVRMLSFDFASDFSIEGEGWYLDDILVTGVGTGGQQPNLTTTQPTGWSDRIVVSRTPGTVADSFDLTPSDLLYVDWAVGNLGTAATGPGFTVQLYVDEVLRNTWTRSTPVGVGTVLSVEDYSIGSLPHGSHTIRLRIDSGNSIQESNEQDNEYLKSIVVSGTPDIRITPLSVGLQLSNATAGIAASAVGESVNGGVAGAMADAGTDSKARDVREILQSFPAGQEFIRVKVNLRAPGNSLRGKEWDEQPRLKAWQKDVKAVQDAVIGEAGAGFKLRHRFENQAGFSAEVTQAVLEKLARHPLVQSIEPVRIVKPMLAQGIPLMGGTTYRSAYNGAGVSVAIVDTGVDYLHPRLGGGSFPNEKVIGGFDFGDFDFDPAPWDSAHGTACAGIVAGSTGTVGDYIGGVAYNAKLYALKITEDGFDGASDDAIIAAWNWCITHKNDDPENPILVISTSFGGGRYFNPCDSSESAYRQAANNAAAAGITVLVSAGNEGYCNALAAPACISSVIAVGSVYDASYGTVQGCIEAESCVPKFPGLGCPDGYYEETASADKVPSYSNTAAFLGLLAPSNKASTTDISGSGGYAGGDYTTSFGGTSAACPYAAGAVAVLQSAARATLGRHLTPGEVKARLVSSGDSVTDTKADVTKPRINIARAIEALGQTASFTIHNDGNAPLNITSILPDEPADWLSWLPAAPFTIGAGEAQVITLSVDPGATPFGQSQRRLLVTSNDSDESPYPGGVFITVDNADTRPVLQARIIAGKLVISWTANSAGYTLQSNSNLGTLGWSPVGTPVVAAGPDKVVTNDITSQRLFYRLEK